MYICIPPSCLRKTVYKFILLHSTLLTSMLYFEYKRNDVDTVPLA